MTVCCMFYCASYDCYLTASFFRSAASKTRSRKPHVHSSDRCLSCLKSWHLGEHSVARTATWSRRFEASDFVLFRSHTWVVPAARSGRSACAKHHLCWEPSQYRHRCRQSELPSSAVLPLLFTHKRIRLWRWLGQVKQNSETDGRKDNFAQ